MYWSHQNEADGLDNPDYYSNLKQAQTVKNLLICLVCLQGKRKFILVKLCTEEIKTNYTR